jgi:hypothetical protein
MPRTSAPRNARAAGVRAAGVCAVVAVLAATTACDTGTPVPTYGADTQPAITFAPPVTYNRPTSAPTSTSRPTSWPLTVCGTAEGPLVRVPDEVCDTAGAQPRDGRDDPCPVDGPDGRVQWWTASELGFDSDDGTEVGEPLDDDYLGENSPFDDTGSFTPPPVPPRCVAPGAAS